MTPIERIKSLIPSLPNKDQVIAQQKIDKRDFEGLWELVKSSIYLVRKHEDKYPEANLADMSVLKSEISAYIDPLDIEEYNDDMEEEEEYISYEEY